MTVSGIILSAGESSRMGRPKALLPWAGTTLVEWQVRQLRLAGVGQVIVVLGHDVDAIKPSLESLDVKVVVNESYREGRASSLRAGAAAVEPAADAVLVLGVDQPRPAAISSAIVGAWRGRGEALIVTPVHAGRRGHPVLLSSVLLDELRAAKEVELGLRGILNRHKTKVVEVEIGDSVVNMDLNTPSDYEAAFVKYGANE